MASDKFPLFSSSSLGTDPGHADDDEALMLFPPASDSCCPLLNHWVCEEAIWTSSAGKQLAGVDDTKKLALELQLGFPMGLRWWEFAWSSHIGSLDFCKSRLSWFSDSNPLISVLNTPEKRELPAFWRLFGPPLINSSWLLTFKFADGNGVVNPAFSWANASQKALCVIKLSFLFDKN